MAPFLTLNWEKLLSPWTCPPFWRLRQGWSRGLHQNLTTHAFPWLLCEFWYESPTYKLIHFFSWEKTWLCLHISKTNKTNSGQKYSFGNHACHSESFWYRVVLVIERERKFLCSSFPGVPLIKRRGRRDFLIPASKKIVRVKEQPKRTFLNDDIHMLSLWQEGRRKYLY